MTNLWYQIKDVLIAGDNLTVRIPKLTDRWYLNRHWFERVIDMEIRMLAVHRWSQFSSGVH